MNKNNPNFDPSNKEIEETPGLVPIRNHQSINDKFHQAFQYIYSKQEVEDNSEVIQDLLDSGGDTVSLRNTSNPKPSLMKKAME